MDYSNDQPIISINDNQIVQFEHYRNALVKLISCSKTPLTIGLFGDWGSGKTSLLGLIKEVLDQHDVRDQRHRLFQTVWFNAWQHSTDLSLWRSFLISVINEFYPQRANQKKPEHLNKSDEVLVQKLDDMINSLYADVSRQELGGVKVDAQKLVRASVESLTHLTLSFIPGVGGFLPKMIEEVQKGLGGNDIGSIFDAIQRESITHVRKQVASLEQFHHDFTELIEDEITQKNKTLVVFIDDLDRCLPEKAIEVLEAIKIFIGAPSVVFIVAIDPKIIVEGVRVKYKDFIRSDINLPINGSDYLEKIIQVPFRLPPMEQYSVDRFIQQCDPDLTEECKWVFIKGLEPNPRKVKRAINSFKLIWEILQSVPDAPHEPGLIAKILVLQDRYPNLYKRILREPFLLPNYLEHQACLKKENNLDSFSEWSILDSTLETSQDRLSNLVNVLSSQPYFRDLSEHDIKRYVYLSSLTRSEYLGYKFDALDMTWNDLLSNDSAKISERIKDIIKNGQQQRWLGLLESYLISADSISKRVSAGTALSILGDHRNFSALTERVDVPDSGKVRFSIYLITSQQYEEYIQQESNVEYPGHWGGNKPPEGLRNHPITNVSWHDAINFCKWLTIAWQKKGIITFEEEVRLPLKKEWQYMAGSGKYPWGDSFNSNYCNTAESKINKTTTVGVYQEGATLYGVLDMVGNVREWVLDGNPNDSCWLCGSSWDDPQERAQTSFAEDRSANTKDDRIGFRVAVAMK